MKINTYLLSLSLCLALIISSCKKVLEVEPQYVKDGSQIFTTLTDYEFALTGAYALFRQTGYYGNGAQTTGSFSTLPDMMGEDLLQTTEDLANFANLTNYVFVASEDDLLVTWLAAYRVVAQSNLVLRNIEQFGAAEPKRVNRIKGQALAIRAMVHFDLLRYWGESYDRNATGLGIPYVTVVDVENRPARLSVKESYDKIFADLNAAETLLADVDATINTSSAKSYIDLNVARALLARINLYAKNYAEAERYASLVITGVPLATAAAFPNIWKDASVADVIWSVPFSAGEGSPSNSLHVASSNRNRYRPTAAIQALFDNKTADVRYASYIASRATGSTAVINTDPASTITRKIVNKYIGRNAALDNLVNWKVFRTGEMYLIRAEARALQTGKEALALTDLNALRAARITGYAPVVLTGEALLNAIYTERRKELFAEGHRWFDLKRTTRVVTRTDNTGAAPGFQATLSATSRIWVFPIPQAEIDANPNLSAQQSPQW